MGLLDNLNDIQGGVSNDPRAQAAPARQGMSPMAKALLNSIVGQRIVVKFPTGEEKLEIVAVVYQ